MDYYGRDGQKLNQDQWAALCNDFDYKVVAQTFLEKHYVSTVWLGLDHGYSFLPGEAKAPIIFETMIFAPVDEEDWIHWKRWHHTGQGRPLGKDIRCDRYATEAAAVAGHDQALSWLREHLKTCTHIEARDPVPFYGHTYPVETA